MIPRMRLGPNCPVSPNEKKCARLISAAGILFSSTSPTPTMIFVSQSEISSRLVLEAYRSADVGAEFDGSGFESGGLPGRCRLLGMPKMKPKKHPVAKNANETSRPLARVRANPFHAAYRASGGASGSALLK